LKQTGSSSAALKTLLDKGFLVESFFEEDRIPYVASTKKSQIELSPAQQEAFEAVEEQFKNQDVVLLEGVTSSGKTEVYFDLMEQILEQEKQVLYLLPEISLTSQMIHRLQDRFGSKVVVYHSKFSIHERVEVWNNIINKQEKAQIILGARSSVFLPFKDLGLLLWMKSMKAHSNNSIQLHVITLETLQLFWGNFKGLRFYWVLPPLP